MDKWVSLAPLYLKCGAACGMIASLQLLLPSTAASTSLLSLHPSLFLPSVPSPSLLPSSLSRLYLTPTPASLLLPSIAPSPSFLPFPPPHLASTSLLPLHLHSIVSSTSIPPSSFHCPNKVIHSFIHSFIHSSLQSSSSSCLKCAISP